MLLTEAEIRRLDAAAKERGLDAPWLYVLYVWERSISAGAERHEETRAAWREAMAIPLLEGRLARYAVAYAAAALSVRDLISAEDFDVLYGPWRAISEAMR